MAGMKGQITLFVALGLALLIIGGLVTFVLTQDKGSQPANIKETDEIKNLIRQCLEINSKEAIKKIGLSGGYLDLDSLNLEADVQYPTKSDFLSYAPYNLPYWYYVDDDTGTTRSYRPLLEFGEDSIKTQIENYLEEVLPECASLEAYEGRVNIEREELVVELDIGNEAVIVNANWPHSISNNGVEDYFTDIIAIQDVDLRSSYNLLDTLVSMESAYNIYSKQTMSLITLYSGINEVIPPIAEVDLSLFEPERIWISSSVKQEIENSLLPIMEVYQVKGTKNYEAYTSDSIFEEGIYKSFDIETPNARESLEVNFVLPSVNREISINGGAQIVRGEKISSAPDLIMKIVGLGITRYKATYSMAYPMIITVKDEEAFDGEGFIFNTAFEVNIENNKPSVLPFSQSSSEFSEASEGIQLLEFDDNPIVVEVYDRHTGLPINDAIVSYTCVEEFFLGRTDSDGKAVGKIPYCLSGGIIEVFHPAFTDYAEFYDHDGSQHSLSIRTWPIKNKITEMHKVKALTNSDLEDITGNYLEEELDEAKDYAMIIIEPLDFTWPPAQVLTFGDSESVGGDVRQSNNLEGLEGFDEFEYPEDFDFEILTEEIQIAPGNYRITAMLLHNEPIHIPKKDCSLISIGCSEIEAQTFKAWPKGGLTLEREFFEEEIYDENVWNFVMQELNTPTTWDNINDEPENYIWDETNQNDYAAKLEIR